MAGSRFVRIDGGRADPLDDVRLVVDDYIGPAAANLAAAAHAGDVDAVRAYALELLAVTGTVVAACPRPPRPRCVIPPFHRSADGASGSCRRRSERQLPP